MRRLLPILGLWLVTPLPVIPQEKPPLPKLKEVHRIADRDVRCAGFNGDSTRLAVGGPRLLRLIDLPFGGASKDLPVADELTELAWEPTDLFLVTRAYSGQTRLLSLPTGREIRVRAEAKSPEDAAPKPPGRGPAAFTPAGTHLALANQGPGLRLWSMDLATARNPEVPERNVPTWDDAILDHVTALRFSGSWLLVGQEGGYLCAFERIIQDATEAPDPKEAIRRRSATGRRTLKDAGVFQPHALDVTSMALTSDQAWLITAGWEGAVKIWKVDDRILPKAQRPPGVPKPPKPAATVKGRFVAWHANRGVLAVAERSGIRLYRFLPGLEKPLIEEAYAPVDSALGGPVRAHFNRAGDLLAVVCCTCGICKGGTAPGQDGNRRAYDHGGRLIVFDAKTYVTADGKKKEEKP